MEKSLFAPLKAEGLTTLKIQRDWKTGKVMLYAAKEWEPDHDFTKYNKGFYIESILTEKFFALNTQQVYDLYAKYNLSEYLGQVLELIKEGKHFGIEAYYYDKYNIRFLNCQHSRKLGVFNKRAATLAGGIRRHEPSDDELEVIIDGLNLGRGMSFKNVAGELDYGGCKTCVQMDELDLNNLGILGFLAYSMERCRAMTGPDMNFPTEMSDVINANFSLCFTNGPKSPLGETGKPTAYGTYLSMKQAVKFKEGTESLNGKSIALMGLGAVGWYMGEYLLGEDVKLYVADINPARTKEFVDKNPGKGVEIVPVKDAAYMDVDIFCPCAIGGIFDDESISKLKCKIIWGSANNQLKASSQEEEYRLAKLIAERDILFQTEWWHNVAGVMCGAEEYIYGKNATNEHLYNNIEATVPAKTWENLNKAKELGITPCECVYRTCQDAIYK
ncbi:MAG: Glu/Leu/Phe/Val dehydrogenase dimerization domain-containing protein [Clostridiaceae bacterium]